jgi:hypothetical protein
MGLCQLRFACGNIKTSRGQINDPYLLALLATYVYNNKNELINNFNNYFTVHNIHDLVRSVHSDAEG